MARLIDAIFLNGTVGTGKTTVARAIGAMEIGPHAVVDLDAIRAFGPSSPEDPFNHELELTNLKSLSENYRKAGAARFVLAGVIEQASEIPRYVSALGSRGLFVCRLTTNENVLSARLAGRHQAEPDDLAWHLARAPQLARILSEQALDDVVLDSSARTPVDLAIEIRNAVGWG
ncbi:chloramphenicol 3-O-phosphotransferase [Salinibacterium sp. CAN_S4]|uniref:AAA family ATPase n=1 Tax=Salinibacterium sp. CAN_S4 TaxID=2787727 RepID=UPI0018F043C4